MVWDRRERCQLVIGCRLPLWGRSIERRYYRQVLGKVFCWAASRVLRLTIRDTGKGIPRDQLPQIFDPFFTTKDGPDETGKGGTGLGLAACKEIIDEHGDAPPLRVAQQVIDESGFACT